MILRTIREMEQHTNFIFKSVEFLAGSQIWLGLCGAGLVVAPIMGIMFIHKESKK